MAKSAAYQYNILLVDDYPPVRQVVKRIIEAGPDLKVIGELSNSLELLEFLKKSSAHLVVLDISMPGLNGLEATRLVKKNYPDIKILILTIHNYREYADFALSVGAEGYLLKEQASDELLPAITSLRQGKAYFNLPV